tara:strand:- start:1919 stop:2164 length:246 start_codon:yes stop_codon:yes gene_type:complete
VTFKNRIISTSHAPSYAYNGFPGERYQRYHEEKARGVPGARLVDLQGAGHNHPRTLRPVIVEHLLAFLKANAHATARDAGR